MSRKHFSSIQTKILFFFTLLTLIMFLSISIIFFNSAKIIIQESKEKELETLSRETSNKIERFLFERTGDIAVMASSPLLKNHDLSNIYKQEYIDSVRANYQTYDYVFVTDEKGNIIISTGNLNGDEQYGTWLDKTLKGETLVSDITYSKYRNSYGIYFTAPIRDKTNKITGAVVELMDLQSVQGILKNVSNEKTENSYIINKHGEILLGSEKKDSQTNIPIILRSDDNVFTYAKAGQEYLAAISHISIKQQEWYLIVEETSDEANSVLNKLRNYVISLTLFSICILFIFGTMLSELITKPIRHLLANSINLAAGETDKNIDIKSSDEIAVIAEQFNTLSNNLRGTMQKTLEISGEAASLIEISEYFNSFFNEMPAGVIAIDKHGQITSFNSFAEKTTGISRDKIIESGQDNYIPKEIYPIAKVLSDSLNNELTSNKSIVEITDFKGKKTSILLNTSLQRDSNEKIIGVVGVFRNLEEIKKFEENINRAKNLAVIGEMAAGMAHEIRNPLTSIRGYAQYIKNEVHSSPAQAESIINDLNIIISEVDRLNDIIQKFLNFAKPEIPIFKKIVLNDMFRRILDILNKDPNMAKVSMRLLSKEPCDADIDEGQFGQLILNILLNAAQSMPDGGNIDISLSFTDDRNNIEIIISDNGIGIPQENLNKIFEPFYSTKEYGSGLGLAICSRIVENHKGTIRVTQKGSAGTDFTIIIPRQISKN